MPIAPGQVVNGRYQIIRQLGQGGFGAVYLAHDLSLNRPCALKENLETSVEVMRQFIREAQLLANLSHPNLPRVIDYFVLAGQGQYLVMDYVEGEDLQDMLDRAAQPLPAAQVLDWIGQVCDALTYLHRHDPPIIHRDIKPGNIRITPRGQAMLVDFGIAKLYDRQTHTTAGARAFTPGYSPPEQYGKGVTDERSDIYALGATLYTLLTNRTPPDSVDLLTGTAPPLPPAHLINPHVSRPVGVAVAQAMDPDRTRRFRSMDQFKAALLAGPLPIAKTQVVGQKPQPPSKRSSSPARPAKAGAGPASRRTSRSFAAWVAGAGVILLLVLLTTYGIVWLAQRGGANLTGPGARQTAAPLQGVGVALEDPTSPVIPATRTPASTDTPVVPPEPGAILIEFPAAKIAFASDHAGDRKDRIYVYEIQPGKFWLTPQNGIQYQLSSANPTLPLSALVAVPIDEQQERAWWPEWCDGNRTILFEAGDKQSEMFQTIYAVAYDPLAAAVPSQITWGGFPMLGVPRCANRRPQAVASARLDLEEQSWQLHSIDLSRPNDPSPVGDGFLPFGGYVAYSGDDSWSVLMHKDQPTDQAYHMIQFQWNDPRQTEDLPLDPRVFSAMYPSISPLTGQVAYACELQAETRREPGSWGLCLQNADGRDFRILEALGLTAGLREGYNRFHVFTPRWSADGRWIAYASPKDGDWDIYLYLLEQEIELNLTQTLSGDQFQPSWSKP